MSITTITRYKCDNCNKEIEAGIVITNDKIINLLHAPYHDSDRALNIDIRVHIENGVDNTPCICKECFNERLSHYLSNN